MTFTSPQPHWGRTGHYTIASFACDQVKPAGLTKLMTANADRISMRIENAAIENAAANGAFVPLADVPDLVWKNLPTAVKGGRDTAFRTGPEHPTHYADIDQPLDGTTLRERCVADPANVSVPVWQDYYTRLGHTVPDERGLLPFRVWQFFDAMVAAIMDKDLARYVAAAGLLAHYVGDACQPLHGSYLSDGFPDGTAKGVHSAYESTMVDRHEAEIVAAIATTIAEAAAPAGVTSGPEAAVAVVQLMDRSATSIDPHDLVTSYAAVATKPGDDTLAVTDALWSRFGEHTIRLLVDGALTLAAIWQSAWTVADGDSTFAGVPLTAVDQDVLQALYEDPGFVPSLVLDGIGPVLHGKARG